MNSQTMNLDEIEAYLLKALEHVRTLKNLQTELAAKHVELEIVKQFVSEVGLAGTDAIVQSSYANADKLSFCISRAQESLTREIKSWEYFGARYKVK